MQWRRKAAENGHANACLHLAGAMYLDLPYAREVGDEEESAGVAKSAGVMEGHNIPPDVLTGVVHWLQKGRYNPSAELDLFRSEALEGARYCRKPATTGARLWAL